MPNTILTPTVIAKEAALQVVNNMVMGRLVHRDFVNEYKKIGDTVTYRKPVKYVVNDGADITSQIQDVTETSDTIVINKRKNIAFQFDSKELTLNIEKFSERYIKPASIRLANQIDQDGLAEHVNVYNAEGTAGTTPNTFKLLAGPSKKLNKFAVPQEERRLVVNPDAHLEAADVLKSLYNPDMVKGAVKRNFIGPIAGMETYMDQNVASHTKGIATGTPLVNGASQTGSSLATDGWTNDTTGILKKGDIITIAGVNSVNPVSRQDTGELQQFVVTADVNSGSTTGPATIPISPAITTSGAYQTVTGSPADNAAITVVANHAANLAFHKNAFALVSVPIYIPEDSTGQRINYKGVSIRFVRGYDVKTDVQIYRLDVMYGWKTIYPDFACRLLG